MTIEEIEEKLHSLMYPEPECSVTSQPAWIRKGFRRCAEWVSDVLDEANGIAEIPAKGE